MTKFYRVKIGYGRDDFISVDEDELAPALRAQTTGKIGIFREGTIAGNHIISITPDFNRLLGYTRDYQLTGEDYKEVGAERQKEYGLFFLHTKLAIEGKTLIEKPKEISNAVKTLAEAKKVIPT